MDYLTLAFCSALGMFCYRFKISRPAILLTYIVVEKWQNLGQQVQTMYNFNDLITRPLFLVLLLIATLLVVRAITNKNKGIDYA